MWIRKLARLSALAINKISQAASIIAIIFLLAMMTLTTSDVFLRYVFNTPILGSVELNEYFVVIAGFLGLAWCAIKGGHVKVDMLISRLPARGQAVIDSITLIIAMTVMPLVAWQCFKKAQYVYLVGTSSDVLKIPEWPFYIIEGLGYTFLVLVMLTLLLRLLGNAIKR